MRNVLAAFSGQEITRLARYFTIYILATLLIHVAFSSTGAFFHFLLNHEMTIVEAWLHTNAWEMHVMSKVIAAWAVIKLLKIQMYRMEGVREFFRKEARLPGFKILVTSVFILLAMISLGKVVTVPVNRSYTTYHLVAWLGTFIWFGCDYITLAILTRVFHITASSRFAVGLLLGVCAWIGFRLVAPDYYGNDGIVMLHFVSMLIFASQAFRHWVNVAIYLLLVAGPTSSLFGLDPFWGEEFSPFRLTQTPRMPFLLIIWMLSWAYYRYRHRWRMSE